MAAKKAPAPKPEAPRPAPRPETPRPAPPPPPPRPAPKPAPAREAPRPAPAPKPAQTARKAPEAAPARVIHPPAFGTKPKPAPKPKPKPAAPAPKPKPAPVANVQWWNVVASREVLGGTGACRKIEPRGYSELSTNINAPTADLDFAALGNLPCLTGLYIRNPANGKVVGAIKQDVGRGSGFHPVMGLYPQTLRDLGLDTGGGEFHVQIRLQDGGILHPASGNSVNQPADETGAQPTRPEVQEYYNPLAHAKVVAERVDQGVDYRGTGYLVAIADGVVSYNGKGTWGKYGNYFEYRITQAGELEDVYVYYAEGVDSVVHEGEAFKAGDRLVDLIDGWPWGIEIGFGAGNGEGWTYYRYHDGDYNDHGSTRPGIAFNNLVKRLGGPGGIVSEPITGSFPEFMQSGEPAPTVTQQLQPSTNPITGLPNIDVGTIGAAYDFGQSFHSAFVQVQRGLASGHSHTNAALAWAKSQTFVTKSD